jgi:L-aminopeptidase/D-esterase-like protein
MAAIAVADGDDRRGGGVASAVPHGAPGPMGAGGSGVITAVAGVRVGHWTDPLAMTGCTVVLFPAGTVASGEVRGGAPGTREWALLAPERTVAHLDAFVVAGGSAFGLAACDGVVRWCEERGIGFPTAAGPVPIVVGAVLYDLMVGDPTVRPDASAGYAACVAATTGMIPIGPVGAGTGATVGKWQGRDRARPGGIGSAARSSGDLVVGALVAVNAYGDVRSGPPLDWPPVLGSAFEQTTVGVVATNASLDKAGCLLVAQSGHDGMARALEPVHATVDGDALVAAAVGGVTVPLDQVRFLAARAVEDAVRAAVER